MAKKKGTCRVCLVTGTTKYLSLYEQYNDCLISDKINAIANIEIKKGDGLPDRICPECLLDLETAYKFKQKCEASNSVLLTNNLTDNYVEVDIKEEKLSPPELSNYGYYDESGLQEEFIKEESVVDEKKKSRAIDLRLECHDCGEFFKSKCKMRVHWKKVHLHSQLICDICKRQFKSYKAFHLHKQKTFKSCSAASSVRVEGIGKLRRFYCKDCEYNSKRMKDMITHLVLHTGDRPYVCNICKRTFTQQSSLQTHQEVAHGEYLIETTCHYCGKHIKGRSKFYKHLRMHQSMPVQCEICKKVLKSKQYLKVHMERHSGVKKYSCEKCAAIFFTVGDLANHKRSKHDKVKRYKCDICGYLAYKAEVIKRHKARHTATNIPCLLCGIFSLNQEEFLIHQRRHFGEKLQCPHCDLKYYGRKNLSKHVRSKHKCTMLMNKHVKPTVVKEENPSSGQFEKTTSLSPITTE